MGKKNDCMQNIVAVYSRRKCCGEGRMKIISLDKVRTVQVGGLTGPRGTPQRSFVELGLEVRLEKRHHRGCLVFREVGHS
jgi:hypothetical protein